jgi:glycosyltransferase involved in cell wall biosynthesis
MNDISVLIINKNYGRFLLEAVNSVLSQTLLPKELIIIDDLSEDESQTIYSNISCSIRERNIDLSLTICFNPISKGVVYSRNKAVTLSSGEYICFLDADDYLETNYLEKTYETITTDSSIGVVYTDFILFGRYAAERYAVIPTEEKEDKIEISFLRRRFPEFTEESKKLLQTRNFIHGGSLFKRTCYNAVGGYVKSNIPEDYNFFKRIISAGWNAKKCNDTYLYYRQHSTTQFNIVGEK